MNLFLAEHDKKACLESKIYRNQTYVVDYGNLNFEERVKLISNDTYYIDKNIIDGKFCIFVDDIKITGSHELTVNKILNQYNVTGNYVFVYYAELLNKQIHPNIENFYNYYAVNNRYKLFIACCYTCFHSISDILHLLYSPTKFCYRGTIL